MKDKTLSLLNVALLSRIVKQLGELGSANTNSNANEDELKADTLKYYKDGYIRINTEKHIEEVKIDVSYCYEGVEKPLRVRFTHTIPDGKISNTRQFPVPTTALATMEDAFVLLKIDGIWHGKIPIKISNNYTCSIDNVPVIEDISIEHEGSEDSTDNIYCHIHSLLENNTRIMYVCIKCSNRVRSDIQYSPFSDEKDCDLYMESHEIDLTNKCIYVRHVGTDMETGDSIGIRCQYAIPIFNLDYSNLFLTYYDISWEKRDDDYSEYDDVEMDED